jgi:hypothetical protein
MMNSIHWQNSDHNPADRSISNQALKAERKDTLSLFLCKNWRHQVPFRGDSRSIRVSLAWQGHELGNIVLE